jgi:hypothetical protein
MAGWSSHETYLPARNLGLRPLALCRCARRLAAGAVDVTGDDELTTLAPTHPRAPSQTRR